MKTLWLVAVCCLLANDAWAENLSADDPPRAKAAVEEQRESATATKAAESVYAAALAEYRAGETGLDRLGRLHNWSLRISQGKSLAIAVNAPHGIGAAEGIAERLQGHLQRMQELQEIVERAVSTGKATAAEKQAMQYFVHEAGLIPRWVAAWGRMEEQRELDVVLPAASDAKPLIAQPKEVFVNLDHEGNIVVGGKQLTAEQLTKTLGDAKLADPLRISVIIRADRRCNLASVVEVINACNRLGISHSLTTSPATED